LDILLYPHPVLRHVSKPLKRVDADLRRMVREMFELMYAAKGIGLAGNQVGLPYRLFVLNLTGDPGQPGEEMVFINPVISRQKGSEESEEGCLSLPGLYQQVRRPETVHLNAYQLDGTEFNGEIDGLFARAAQHETDHLDGVLFIDRLSETAKLELRDELSEFELNFAGQQQRGEIGADDAIARVITELELMRT